jgi:hypothetical protein
MNKDIVKRMREEYNHMLSLAMFEAQLIRKFRKQRYKSGAERRRLQAQIEKHDIALQKLRDLDQTINEAATLIMECDEHNRVSTRTFNRGSKCISGPFGNKQKQSAGDQE